MTNDVWGVEVSMDLKHCDPVLIRNEEAIRHYVELLCEKISVKKFGECQVVNFGTEERVSGYSMTQLIETSLISGHFVNKTNAAYINIFSCSSFDAQKAAEFTRMFFGARSMEFIINYRTI